MSDDARQFKSLARRIGQTEVRERSPLYLPWSQRVLNPFPLASSGGVWGDQGQPYAVTILAFYCSVFVVTTNNATNYWTLVLTDSGAVPLASLSTASVTANTWTRLGTTTISPQPGSTNAQMQLIPQATLSPGAIYIAPAVALLRTG